MQKKIYEGGWNKGKKFGKGKTFYKEKIEYDGEWKDDKKNGKGILNILVNDKYGGWYPQIEGKYLGNWKNDFLHGLVVEYYSETFSSINYQEEGYHKFKHGKKKWEGIYENGQKKKGRSFKEDELDNDEIKIIKEFKSTPVPFITNYEIESKYLTEPKKLSLSALNNYIKEFKIMIKEVEWVLDNYEKIYEGFKELKQFDENYKKECYPYEEKKDEINNSLFAFFKKSAVEDLNKKILSIQKDKFQKVDVYCKKLSLKPHISENILSHRASFEEILLWKVKGRVYLPGDHDFASLGYESFFNDKLIEVNEAKEYLNKNIIKQAKEQLTKLNNELSKRES